ncbi:hypothetical protein BDZ91DRAFT_802954 [Kalaharituber pfeilii]|nr:hypothetical protein BDZ91DRAFT_802954 [Kalaharituber pfeilii]
MEFQRSLPASPSTATAPSIPLLTDDRCRDVRKICGNGINNPHVLRVSFPLLETLMQPLGDSHIAARSPATAQSPLPLGVPLPLGSPVAARSPAAARTPIAARKSRRHSESHYSESRRCSEPYSLSESRCCRYHQPRSRSRSLPPKVKQPRSFSGKQNELEDFLLSVEEYFEQPSKVKQ